MGLPEVSGLTRQMYEDFVPETTETPTDYVDPFKDDEPVGAVCDLSNPEICESCT